MAGGVIDGQAVDQVVTNPAFIFKNNADTMPFPLGFSSLATNKIQDTQVLQNNLASTVGLNESGDFTAEADTTGKIYGTNQRATDGLGHKQAIAALDSAFHPTTGHKHTGITGDAPQIAANEIAGVPLRGYFVQGITLTGITGGSTVVTSQLVSIPNSGSPTVEGAVTNTPYNKVPLKNSANETDFLDGSGNIVYGRLTWVGGVYTLTYYSNVSGTETPYSFVSSSGIDWYFQQLFSPIVDAPVYDPAAFLPSVDATADIIAATTTLQGKTQLATAVQPVAAAGSAGTANATVANADHSHEGLHSIHADANAQLTGDVQLVSGAGVTLTQVGQVITVAVASPLNYRAGSQALASADLTKSIMFSTPMPSANFAVVCTFTNLTDATVAQYLATVTAKSTTGFSVAFSDAIENANYLLDWNVIGYA